MTTRGLDRTEATIATMTVREWKKGNSPDGAQWNSTGSDFGAGVTGSLWIAVEVGGEGEWRGGLPSTRDGVSLRNPEGLDGLTSQQRSRHTTSSGVPPSFREGASVRVLRPRYHVSFIVSCGTAIVEGSIARERIQWRSASGGISNARYAHGSACVIVPPTPAGTTRRLGMTSHNFKLGLGESSARK